MCSRPLLLAYWSSSSSSWFFIQYLRVLSLMDRTSFHVLRNKQVEQLLEHDTYWADLLSHNPEQYLPSVHIEAFLPQFVICKICKNINLEVLHIFEGNWRPWRYFTDCIIYNALSLVPYRCNFLPCNLTLSYWNTRYANLWMIFKKLLQSFCPMIFSQEYQFWMKVWQNSACLTPLLFFKLFLIMLSLNCNVVYSALLETAIFHTTICT